MCFSYNQIPYIPFSYFGCFSNSIELQKFCNPGFYASYSMIKNEKITHKLSGFKCSRVYTTVTGFNLQTGDKHGTATVGNTNYNVFMLTSTTTTYTMNFSAASASNIYMLVVGAGGGAASCSGGGGGGAVVMATVSFNAFRAAVANPVDSLRTE